PVSLMGPTGVRAKIPKERETVLIIGNQFSLAFLRSYGASLRKAGNQVIYLGHFNAKEEVYCQEQLENAADVIIWNTKKGQPIIAKRNQDRSLPSVDIIQALIAYAQEKNSETYEFPRIQDVDRIFVVGDTELLRRFQAVRKTE